MKLGGGDWTKDVTYWFVYPPSTVSGNGDRLFLLENVHYRCSSLFKAPVGAIKKDGSILVFGISTSW